MLLKKVVAIYTLRGENRFRIIAYERTIESLEKSPFEAKDLWKEGRLMEINGIGQTISAHLDELFRIGKVEYFEELFSHYPDSMFPLLEVAGLGPKKAYYLADKLRLKDPTTAIEDLLKAAYADKIAKLEGFGSKSQSDIIDALERFREGQKKEVRISLPLAEGLAQKIIDYLNECSACSEIFPLGSLRRQLSTIGDIDLAVATNKPQTVLDWFTAYPHKSKVIESGPAGATIILSGGQHVDLRVQDPTSFGSMLQYFTGSKHHNIHLREIAIKQGLSLSEYGIKPINKIRNSKSEIRNYNDKKNLYEFAKEKDYYRFLGLEWIPPELREDNGEIEAAKNHNLPLLIEKKDIKGEFHIHTSYNLEPSHDLGLSDLKTILLKADSLGYEYIGISDHNPSKTHHTESEIISIMKARKYYYEQIKASNKNTRVNLFIMLETDILTNGELALPNDAFEYIDASIVSIHSNFNMNKVEMTDRILKGLSHPKAKMLAHPTGRLINKRAGYDLDWQKIFSFCRINDKALEINSFPDRLDLSDMMVREAIKNQVKLVINTDSHEVSQMDLIKYGISVARRGWSTKADILNCMPYNKVKEWLKI